MPRGRRRDVHDEPAPSDSPAITIEEAQRRGLWAIYRIRKGAYTFISPGKTLEQLARVRLTLVTWAVDREAAKRACVQLGREDRHPTIAARADRPNHGRRRRTRPRPPLPQKPVDRSVFPCNHPRTPENTYVYGDRATGCRQCRQTRSLKNYYARKEATP